MALMGTYFFAFANYFIYRRLCQLSQTSDASGTEHEDTPFSLPRITVIARGVAQNDELQHTDEATLGRALAGRIPFNV